MRGNHEFLALLCSLHLLSCRSRFGFVAIARLFLLYVVKVVVKNREENLP